MKTRSNMPLFVVECEDVKALSNSQIDLLRCGDYLVKKDASGEHAYKVTFKSDTGMCITYHDASVIETQSYDKVDGNWVYNSEDKTPNLLDAQTQEDVEDLIEGGTLDNAKPIYYHGLACGGSHAQIQMMVLNNNNTPFTKTTLLTYIKALMDNYNAIINCNGAIEVSDDGVCPVYLIMKVGSDYKITYHTTTELVKYVDLDTFWNDISIVNDGVNKIN